MSQQFENNDYSLQMLYSKYIDVTIVGPSLIMSVNCRLLGHTEIMHPAKNTQL